MADRLDSTGLSHLWSALKALFGGKAEKVSNATNGNFAGLDANGNLTDSGHKHSDYLTSHQDISGKADKVTGATNDNFASLDANGNLKDSGHKHSDYLTSHQDISGKVSGPSSATNNAVALFNGTGGKTIKDSAKTITDKTASTAMANDANICTNRTILNSYYNGLDKTASGFALDAKQGKMLNDAIGNLSNLKTPTKTNLVSAINETFRVKEIETASATSWTITVPLGIQAHLLAITSANGTIWGLYYINSNTGATTTPAVKDIAVGSGAPILTANADRTITITLSVGSARILYITDVVMYGDFLTVA